MAAIEGNRRTARRFTDQEIEEILEYSRGFVNGAKKRQRIVGISMATLLGLTTLINVWIVSPLKEQIASLSHEVREIDMSVRKHHEDQDKLYVSKEDEKDVKKEMALMESKLDKLIEYHIEGKGHK